PTDLLGKVFPKASSDVLGKLLLNLPKMKTNLDELAKSSGAMQDAFDKASSSMGFRLSQLAQKFEALQVTMGEAFAPLVKEFGDWFDEHKDDLEEFFKVLAERALEFSKVILPLLGGILQLLTAIMKVLVRIEELAPPLIPSLQKLFGGKGKAKQADIGMAGDVAKLLDEMKRQQVESEAKERAKIKAQEERNVIAAQNKMQETVDAVTEKLRTQIATFGMTNDQIEIYKLRLKGATSAQIRMVEVLQAQAAEQNKQAEKNKQAEQAHRKSLQEVLAAREMLSRAAPAVQSRFMTDAPNRILNVQVRHQVEANQMAARRERLLTRVVDELRRIRMDGGGLELQRADL
ncbi:MAG TPA: phage tail tape measure protein, partial [Planctomycetota bacterium]|nr:phage tail tape measure protein [Planctomycetota bacterium]